MHANSSAPTSSTNSNSNWASLDDDFDDDDGWQDMPVVRDEPNALGLDDEDAKKYHYTAPAKASGAAGGDHQGNATGNLIDFDDEGYEWRSKLEQNESDYTRVRLNDDNDADDAYLRTKYLFDEDKAMTPLSQMQQTKNLLTEAQRIAYVGLCALVSREMSQALKRVGSKELQPAIQNMELWALKIMGRLYYHMELETAEQKMIESLAEHGVNSMDLVPSLMTTHTVHNPEYDPAEASRKAHEDAMNQAHLNPATSAQKDDDDDEADQVVEVPHTTTKPDLSTLTPRDYTHDPTLLQPPDAAKAHQTTANVMTPTSPLSMPGVSTSLSSTDENVTLDIRWTVLCDLFLILIADSVYDSRSRVLLENVAAKMGLGWLDVVKFEKRVTDALEIQEGVEQLKQQEILNGRENAAKKRRYVMMGLATLGGGLVIGLSAGLLAPVIGAGLGAAFTTIGITGTTGFLAGAGGAAVITTGGVLTGSGIAGRGMAKRTKQVHTFELLPLHNNKRLSCIITVPGFMNGKLDDPRLPFGVLDPIVGDVFSVLWEPEMMEEMGSALKILTSEVLSQVGTTVLQATVMTALMSALQWPIILTKLGYLIDNPWSNALDRSKAAGLVLADVLLHRSLGVRPITLMGFSLGARAIFFCLLELARNKALGIVQDVFLLGATVSASQKQWLAARGIVAGRFVNGYARNDWLLNYLFRATAGGLNTVAGLRPVESVPGLENVDMTDKIAGHLSYRTYMPVILDQLGFPVTATWFDEPEDPDMDEDRVVVKEDEQAKPKSGFGLFGKKSSATPAPKASMPPTASSSSQRSTTPGASTKATDDDDLPERMEKHNINSTPPPARTSLSLARPSSRPTTPVTSPPPEEAKSALPKHAGFDFQAIGKVLGKENLNPDDIKMPTPHHPPASLDKFTAAAAPLERSESAPPLNPDDGDVTPTGTPQVHLRSLTDAKANESSVSGGGVYGAGHLKMARSVSEFSESSSNPSYLPPSLEPTPRLTFNSETLPPTSGAPFISSPLAATSRVDNGWSANPYTSVIDSTPWRSTPTTSSQSLYNTSIYPPPTETLSFGGSDGSISSFGAPPPAPVLSFGFADGSISSTALVEDPWAASAPQARNNGAKKGTRNTGNPWM